MSWFRLDDKGAFHAKVTSAGNEAYGAWCRAGQLSCSLGSDGFIPFSTAKAIAPERVWRKLLSVGLLDPAEGGYQIHDFAEYNPTSAEVIERRAEISAARAQAGRRGGLSTQAKLKQTPSKREAELDFESSKTEAPIPYPIPEDQIPPQRASAGVREDGRPPAARRTLFDPREATTERPAPAGPRAPAPSAEVAPAPTPATTTAEARLAPAPAPSEPRPTPPPVDLDMPMPVWATGRFETMRMNLGDLGVDLPTEWRGYLADLAAKRAAGRVEAVGEATWAARLTKAWTFARRDRAAEAARARERPPRREPIQQRDPPERRAFKVASGNWEEP